MCGFLFHLNKYEQVDKDVFNDALIAQQWRGPDAMQIKEFDKGNVLMGHCRLSILDPFARSDQPMISVCNRYVILFNGEIYNHLELRKKLNLVCQTNSDTETILAGYISVGNKIFSMLDGMFAIVIFNTTDNSWVLARDAFGIKPLFYFSNNEQVVIGSEPSSIRKITKSPVSSESIAEWRMIRRPTPGFSFFSGIQELLPGKIIDSNGKVSDLWSWVQTSEAFSQDKFEQIIYESVKSHELSDVDNVSLLSGGLDSAIIASLSDVRSYYTVGLENNNELAGAQDTASKLPGRLIDVILTESQLEDTWRRLTHIRGEPLSLPNEGLIYNVCSRMKDTEKVVLTGEGADEVLFGYDRIFRWAANTVSFNKFEFIERYGYSKSALPTRLSSFIDEMAEGKSAINFTEDFFYQVHLPGLLRRMDFASMAASKEARVPFVCKSLIAYMYRMPASVKLDDTYSKVPIRRLAKKLNLNGALDRKKIGFSAQRTNSSSNQDDYLYFQDLILKELKW